MIPPDSTVSHVSLVGVEFRTKTDTKDTKPYTNREALPRIEPQFSNFQTNLSFENCRKIVEDSIRRIHGQATFETEKRDRS